MKKIILMALTIGLFAAGCKEKMELTLDQSSSKIVIEGSITNEFKQHVVKISQSTDYFYNNQTPAASGASVSVSDGSNAYIFTESLPGTYISETAFAGIPGKTYQLNVNYNNETYTAQSTMIPVAIVDSIQLEKADMPIQPGVILDPDKNYYNILLYSQEPGETENYYMMDAYRNGVLQTDTLSKKFIADDMIYNGSYVYGAKMIQVEANTGDTIEFQLASIEKDYCMYVFAIQGSTMGGSPFSGPPSNFQGNISNGGLGYFYATAISSKAAIVK